MDRIGFGAAYYPEYQRHPDLRADFDLMAKAGFSVIRVGESVWSTWEPEEGRFELDWLEPVLDAAREQAIGVILGTPVTGMLSGSRYPPAEVVSTLPCSTRMTSFHQPGVRRGSLPVEVVDFLPRSCATG